MGCGASTTTEPQPEPSAPASGVIKVKPAAAESSSNGQSLPAGVEVVAVVGGHARKADVENRQDGKSFIIVDGWLHKPFQVEHMHKVEAEIGFYEEVKASSDETLKSLTPKYDGTAEVSGHKYIKMENLMAGYSKPCAMDIKLGQRSYADDATPAKKEKMIKMYPERERTGFQVVGFKNYHPPEDKSRDW